MRSETEMLDLILNTAREDERIRAVMMNGSRTVSASGGDIFQDFDIVYFVIDPAPFIHNLDWIRRFGELMILQLPNEMQDPPPTDTPGYTYLMQFIDGNRIDLTIYPVSRLAELEEDSQSILFLDKDGLFGKLDPPSNASYLPSPPSAKQFGDCVNEFWWVCACVAKGLWREEILYAKGMSELARHQMLKMLVWYTGIRTAFSVTPGKFGKHLPQLLEPELSALLLKTYAGAGSEENWEALFCMAELFRRAALQVAGHFGFDYAYGDDERVSKHLQHVRRLPRDAREMY